MKKKIIILFLIILTFLLFSFTVLVVGFRPGLMAQTYSNFTSRTFEGIKNLLITYKYISEISDLKQYNVVKKRFDFEIALQGTLEGTLKMGKLLWHEGRFEEALEHLNKALGRKELWRKSELNEIELWKGLTLIRLIENTGCTVERKMAFSDLYRNKSSCDEKKSNDYIAEAKVIWEKVYTRDQSYSNQWLLSYLEILAKEKVSNKEIASSTFFQQFTIENFRKLNKKHYMLKLKESAKSLNVDLNTAGRGLAVEDFDNDGDFDIITGGTTGHLAVFENLNGKIFKKHFNGLAPKIDNIHLLSAVDYNNDGRVDLFIIRPGQNHVLLKNLGSFNFENVTAKVGLLYNNDCEHLDSFIQGFHHHSWIPEWGDFDNDGDLDLFISNTPDFAPFPVFSKRYQSRLYKNENGKFIDITKKIFSNMYGIDNNVLSSTLADFNNDFYPDLFISSPSYKKSVLYLNREGKLFEAVKTFNLPGFASTAIDINHDGQLDILQTGSDLSAENTMAYNLFNKKEDEDGVTRFYIQKDGKFKKDVSLFQNNFYAHIMGVSYGDLNLDGHYDFYLGTGSPDTLYIFPNLFYLSDAKKGVWENISALNGLATIQEGHGISFFDFDDDGDLDIYSSLGGMWPGDEWENQFFVNESDFQSNWIKIRLRGIKTNYFGIGARVKLVGKYENGDEYIRYYNMDDKFGFGSGPFLIHVGIPQNVEIKFAQVRWPASKKVSEYNVKLNSFNLLKEN
jgi:hypothetical protein